MKIWLIYKVAMAFWINIHGCQPYPRNSHLCTKSAQKPKLLLATVHKKPKIEYSNQSVKGKLKLL